MINVLKTCVLLATASYVGLCCAASPVWVVKVLRDLRVATQTVLKTKNGVKLVVQLGKCQHALSEAQVDDLAKAAARPGGLDSVGATLGKMNLITKYGDDVGHLVLQDAYLRIAVRNGKMSEELAADTLKYLSGTPGLTSLLRKVNSVNPAVVKGHLRELQIGLRAKERGFQVVSFGQKFSDGIKKGDTDLDVFLTNSSGTRHFAVESKAYSGAVPNDMVRADAESLCAFSKEIGNTTPVFCFETMPSEFSLRWLEERGVMAIVGNPEEIASKLDVLVALQ